MTDPNTLDAARLGLVNALVCVAASYVCACRLNAASARVRVAVRLQFVLTMAAAIVSALTPAFGHPVTLGQLAIGCTTLGGLWLGRHRWGNGPPHDTLKGHAP